MVPQAVSEHYATQQRLQQATVAAVRTQWARMGNDFDAPWAQIGRRITLLITAGQLGSARNGSAYITPTLAELGEPTEAMGRAVPAMFAGVASDGRPLPSLAYEAVIHTKAAVGSGDTVADALTKGGSWLDMMTTTQLADAARGAAGVEITARPRMGYTRMLSPPSCSRCAVLAGGFYRYSSGFQRHPGCDCQMVPTTEAGASNLTTDPKAYFTSLAPAEQDRLFTNAGAQAIRDGADLGKVVNARLPTPAGGVRGGRVMPEHIYSKAGSRDEAVALLKKYGYIR